MRCYAIPHNQDLLADSLLVMVMTKTREALVLESSKENGSRHLQRETICYGVLGKLAAQFR